MQLVPKNGRWDPEIMSYWYEEGTCSPHLGRAVQVQLLHRDEAGNLTSVGSWRIPADGEEPIATQTMVDKVGAQVQMVARGSGEGITKFWLQMSHGEPGKAPVQWDNVLLFWEPGPQSFLTDPTLGFSETTSKRGQDSQSMRHVEILFDKMIKMVDITHRVLGTTIVQQSQRLEFLETRHWQTVALYEQLLDQRNERELKVDAHRRNQEKISKLYDILFTVIPMIGAKFAGIPALALPAHIHRGGPAMDLVRQIMKKLRPEQIPELQKALDMDQTMALLELHQLIAAEEEENAQKKANEPKIAVTSRDDIPQTPLTQPVGGQFGGLTLGTAQMQAALMGDQQYQPPLPQHPPQTVIPELVSGKK